MEAVQGRTRVAVVLRQVENSLRSRQLNPAGWLSSPVVAVSALIYEAALIFAAGMISGVAYHHLMYGGPGDLSIFARVSGLVAFGFTTAQLVRGDYAPENLLEGRRTNTTMLVVWVLVFLSLGVIGFLTKSAGMFSRGWMLSYLVTGYVVILFANAGLKRIAAQLYASRIIRRRKLLIVGVDSDIDRLRSDIADGAASVLVIGEVSLDPPPGDDRGFDERLQSAVELARSLNVEDVVISSAISHSDHVERCIHAFSLLPVAIHLGAGSMISRFKDAQIARLGRASALSLMRQPLGPWEGFSKRVLDVVAASIAVVLLSPLLAVIALAIKLDSSGPVFFRQRRRGFNLEEFQIWKFRTMTTLEDGDVVRQATRGDARVTRIGQFLRRYSLDELPQLLNVLSGDMSLVGPRPHAVAHDQIFEKKLRFYPRRLNMKPGITGWAQVNGFRGATLTDDAMEQRLQHDLYYIDNWSLAFDIYIMLLTLISPKASSNAY